MKICAMLRVRNEARWLPLVLPSILPLTADIVVFDDHSTDYTREIVKQFGCELLPSPFPEEFAGAVRKVNESRDKNYLLDAVRDRDYILSIDGDEILEAGAAEKLIAAFRPSVSCYSMGIKYLWNDMEHYRADGVYGRYARFSAFSLVNQPNVRFTSTGGCNFHCGNVPVGLVGSGCQVGADLLHTGYMLREDRLRKYEWYRALDPGNRQEDEYRHMVIGDVFPEDSKFLHGGPLKVFTLAAGKRIET